MIRLLFAIQTFYMGVLLATQTNQNIDISTLTEVLRFTYVGTDPALILTRMIVSGISGDGLYYPRIYVNDFEILPSYPVSVQSGVTGFVVQARTDVLIDGDVVSLKLLGQVSDASISCVSHIVDIGSGTQLSDEDFQRITDMVVAALSNVNIRKERVVLAPIPQSVKKLC